MHIDVSFYLQQSLKSFDEQFNWQNPIQKVRYGCSDIFASKHKHSHPMISDLKESDQNTSMCTEVRICVTVRENRFYLNRHTHTLRTALCIVETAAALGRDAPSPKYAM